jgi:drug/metabolite transporter (DMT)-like permease
MPMDVFLMVLAAALLHATWNAVVKSNADRLSLIRVLAGTQLAVSLCLLPFVPMPRAEAWPYLIASAVLSTAYLPLLNRAYHFGDLSLVYPLARGVAPLAVAIVSAALLGEQLSHANQIAVLLIGVGITSLALTRGGSGLRDPRPVLLALGTGALIAVYTVLDGVGARLSGSAIGYMAVLMTFVSLLTLLSVTAMQQAPRPRLDGRTLRLGIESGLISYLSTGLVLSAYTMAPIALVSALRETGIVFAVIIGVVVLKERLNFARLASIAATLLGTTLLKVGR